MVKATKKNVAFKNVCFDNKSASLGKNETWLKIEPSLTSPQVACFGFSGKLSIFHPGIFKRLSSFLTKYTFSVPAVYRRSKRISNKIPCS